MQASEALGKRVRRLDKIEGRWTVFIAMNPWKSNYWPKKASNGSNVSISPIWTVSIFSRRTGTVQCAIAANW